MALSSPNDDLAVYYGFKDIDGFKDFLIYVLSYAPDLFPKEDWRTPDNQMNLERAFTGLRYGLTLFPKRLQNSVSFLRCSDLIERAYQDYRSGRDLGGQHFLEEVEKLLQTL